MMRQFQNGITCLEYPKHTPNRETMQSASEQPATATKRTVKAPALSDVAVSLLASPAAKGSPEPYTLAKHISNFQPGTKAPRQYVQIRDYVYKHSRCGVIRDLWTTPDGTDLWVVDLVDGGRMHAHPNKTAQCSRLDGRCMCAGESGLSAFDRLGPSIWDENGKAAD